MNQSNPELNRVCLISMPVEAIQELASSECEEIRARVAEYESTPHAVLQHMLQDSSPYVRISLALNPKVPAVLLAKLAADTNADVRFTIAENPHTAIGILINLTADENPYVALRAERTIEAIVSESSEIQGGIDMSARTIEQTMRRMLNTKERLNRNDAVRLKKLILADGYLSRGEKKLMTQAIENNLLDDQAFEIFLDLLLYRCTGESNRRATA